MTTRAIRRRAGLLPTSTNLLAVMVVAAATLSGCNCGGTTSPGEPCTDAGGCPEGLICVDGECVAGEEDGGPPPACVDVDGDGFDGHGPGCPDGDDCDDHDFHAHPGAVEACGDGADNDCDGETDESDCGCRRGERITCYPGPPATRNVGACRDGAAVCTATDVASECLGATVPADEETCDFVDNDCDGEIDEGLRNACGECAPEVLEQCNDGIDNDCNGQTDEGCDCDFRCECAAGTSCECQPPTNQPCYEGPHASQGKGICHGGRRDCVDMAGELRWDTCVDQVLPGTECDGGPNGADDDCDGLIDEGCRDTDGDGSPWPTDCNDDDPAVHPGAAEICNDVDDNCNGIADEGVTNGCGGCYEPADADECGNGLDDNCDGRVDESCGCAAGMQDCYRGPPGTAGVGTCRTGSQTCANREFAVWGECTGDIGPLPERCDGVDNDCDGETDERWAVGSNACGFCESTEVCDGMDNDCDGLVDEYVANRCGECGAEPVEVCDGLDNDCDGVVDEGVVNACGLCPPNPCFEEIWDTPAECGTDGRVCDGVEEDPDYPGSITLGETAQAFDHIYIAVTNRHQVAQINTDTGAVNWQVDSHGRRPSRTAVARDGSVWVSNRAHASGDNSSLPEQSNFVHLTIDGAFVCRADAPGIARGLAIDADGNVWGGTFDGRRIYKISGTEVDSTMSPVRCRILATYDVGQQIYGLAVDPSGYLWSASSPAVRLDTRTGSWETVANPSHYGVAADGVGNVWYGGWRNSTEAGIIHALRPAAGGGFEVFNTAGTGATAVTVHPDGTVWASRYGQNQIIGVNPTTGAVICTAPLPAGTGTNPHGIAVDHRGRLWVPSRYGGYVNVFDTSCAHIVTYPVDVGQELYSYSDMTGHLLRTFTAPEGTWSQDFDSGYADADWARIEWDSIVPADTAVEVTAYAADDPSLLGSAPACGPFTTAPADLSGCADIANHRYLRVIVRLISRRTGARPVVHEIRAFWEY